DGPLDRPHQLLPEDGAHAGAHEAEFGDRQRERATVQPGGPGDQRLTRTALTLGRRYFVGVGLAAGGEPERVGRFEPGVPLHEAAGVGQHRDPLRGGEAEVVVAAWANPQFALELARVGQLAAAWALDPEVIGYDRAVLALWFRREARL